MIRNKENFYQSLWEDYISFEEKDRDKSFIYGYLKKKKDYRAEIVGQDKEALYQYSGQKKRDKYIMLKGAYIALTENCIITEQEYTDIFKELIGKLDKASGKLVVPAKYENMIGRNDIDNAQKMFERRFLMGCVSDFFYNLGYRTNKNTEHGQSVKLANKRIKEDGYNDEFDMLYHFNRYKDSDIQESTDAGSGTLDDAYIEKCERLYRSMIKEGRKDGFVPLYIDERTGAGIYIIGCNRFHEETYGYSYRKTGDVCFVCVINFSMIDNITPDYGVDNMCMEMCVEKIFNSVPKAFDYFIGFVTELEGYKNYPSENDDELPRKIDEEFNLFFISKADNAKKLKAAIENDYERRIKAKIEEKKKAEESKTGV